MGGVLDDEGGGLSVGAEWGGAESGLGVGLTGGGLGSFAGEPASSSGELGLASGESAERVLAATVWEGVSLERSSDTIPTADTVITKRVTASMAIMMALRRSIDT